VKIKQVHDAINVSLLSKYMMAPLKAKHSYWRKCFRPQRILVLANFLRCFLELFKQTEWLCSFQISHIKLFFT